MHQYKATVHWSQNSGDFAKGTYGRRHRWEFDGGAICAASSSPTVVPAPYSDPSAIDPEEAMVAAISSCHMMWFLDVARRAGYVVLEYRDQLIGKMRANSEGNIWLSNIDLHPKITWQGREPAPTVLADIHDEAHHNCYLANSVKTDIQVHS